MESYYYDFMIYDLWVEAEAERRKCHQSSSKFEKKDFKTEYKSIKIAYISQEGVPLNVSGALHLVNSVVRVSY